MAYIEKIVGNTCSSCHVGKYVKNPKTGKTFCDKKCWLNGSTGQPTPQNAPQTPYNAPQAIPTQAFDELKVQIGELNQAIQNIRTWAIRVEKDIQGLRSLAAFTESKVATELHNSFPPVDLHEPSKKFDFKKAIEMLQDPDNFNVDIKL